MRTFGLVVPFLTAQKPASEDITVIQDVVDKFLFTKYGIGEHHGEDTTTFSCLYLIIIWNSATLFLIICEIIPD